MSAVGGIILIGIVIAIYFIPTWVSGKHPQKNAIFALNLLLGWTLLGWVAALVWALTKSGPDPALAINKAAVETNTKQCPFCAETILAAAIVCRHCNRDLPNQVTQ